MIGKGNPSNDPRECGHLGCGHPRCADLCDGVSISEWRKWKSEQ